MKTINRKSTTKIFAALIAILLFAAYFSFVSIPSVSHADDTEAVEYNTTAVDITNSSFAESESDYPATATGWSGEYLDNSTGGLISGVIDISPDAMNLADNTLDEAYNLKVYDEYKYDVPRTPFGREGKEDDEGKVLLLNSYKSDVAYAYKSNTISLSKNSYYGISVWVKTSSNAEATIKLARPGDGGFKNEVAFRNVNTFHTHGDNYASVNKNEDKDFGWVEYSFYIETSTLSDTSVILSLQLGDHTKWVDEDGKEQSTMYTSNGYAMFDNISVYQYAPDVFDGLISNFNKDTGEKNSIPSENNRYYYTEKDAVEATKMFYSECDAVELSVDQDGKILGLGTTKEADYDKYNVGSFEPGKENTWGAADGSRGSRTGNGVNFGIYSTTLPSVGIRYKKDIPFSPDGTNNSIALMSSYRAGNRTFDEDSYGYASPDFMLTRHKFYKLSVWTKSINANAANVIIRGQNYKGLSVDDNKDQLYFASGLTGLDGGIESRNGWTEVAFFFEGSSFADYKVHVELWLGTGAGKDNDGNAIEEEKVAGIAMFDNLRIEELTSTEYTNYSGSGTTVTFDASTESTGFANSSFDKVGDYTKYEYPMAPKSWTYYEVSDNTTSGASKDRVVEYSGQDGLTDQKKWDDHIARGVINTDEDAFNRNQVTKDGRSNYGALVSTPGTADGDKHIYNRGNNALLISSDMSVAVGYASSTVSVSANLTYTIDVKMKTYDMGGYGANLVLKKGENIISTIEEIGTKINKNSGNYETYSFYVQGGDSDVGDLSLEIWLGLYTDEDGKNITKLGSGTIVIDDVNLTQHEEGLDTEYNQKYSSYLVGSDNGTYGVYSFKYSNFMAYDRYSDKFIKTSYDYNVTSGGVNNNVDFGVFDSSSMTAGNGYLWSGYDNDNASGYKHKLYLANNASTYSRVTANYRKNIAGNAYYKITFKVKVNIPTNQNGVQYKGAYVGVNSGDTDYIIQDIKNTAKIFDVTDVTTSKEEADLHNSDNLEYFRDFSIYIKGSGEEDDSTDVNFVFGIGGDRLNYYASGKMIIANISVDTIDDLTYSSAKEKIESKGTIESRTSLAVSFAEDEEEEDDDDDSSSSTVSKLSKGQNWLLVTGVIIAIAVIVAVVAVAVRHLARKRKTAAIKAGGMSSYDRKATLNVQHNKRAGLDDAISYESDDYEQYDEDLEYENYKDDEKKQVASKKAEVDGLADLAESPDAAFDEDIKAEESDEAAEIVAEGDADVAEETADETAGDSDSPAENAEATSDEATPAEVEATPAEEEVEAEPEAEADEEINYDEVVEFKAPEFKSEKKTETLEEAIEKAKQQEDEEDIVKVEVNDWDTFDE